MKHIPFIRMFAGSMDYTPGGLFNANERDFRIVNERPMTQGTRSQQLAMFTMLYAPLEMLSDTPTAYEAEPDILHYLAGMPTTWDETVPLDGEVGGFAVIARRKGSDWFVSGMTDWTSRTVKVKFDFLTGSKYSATLFTDGPNANRMGNDYLKSEMNVTKDQVIEILMAEGGGFAMRISVVR
jgi:alpha-glucosidase